MSETNQLYELTRMIDDKESMESDLSEIFANLREMVQKKYVHKLHHVVETQQRQVTEHPPREVTLLRALREFTTEDQRKNLDRMIDMTMMMNTATKMRKDLGAIAERTKPTQSLPGDVHARENEDQSLQTSAGVTNILLTLALMKII